MIKKFREVIKWNISWKIIFLGLFIITLVTYILEADFIIYFICILIFAVLSFIIEYFFAEKYLEETK